MEKKIVVTRHKSLVEYLIEQGIVDEKVDMIAHATPENVEGRHVVGVLPHSLSCLCQKYTEVPLFLPPELRGKELNLAEVKKYAQPTKTYIILEVE